MTEHKGACCSSPAAICYWFAASLIAWGVLSFMGIFWRPLHGSSAVTILFAMAIGCVANWLRNHTFHCAITGPLFLIAGLVFLTVRRDWDARQQRFGLAIRTYRGRHRISTRMAVYEAFRIVALTLRLHIPGDATRS